MELLGALHALLQLGCSSMYACKRNRPAVCLLHNYSQTRLLCGHPSLPPGLLCIYAHDYSELRREASVQQGNLNPKYKTTLCQAFAATGRQGRTKPGWGWDAWGAPVRVHCRGPRHVDSRPASSYQTNPP